MTRNNLLCVGIYISLCTNASALTADKQLIKTDVDFGVNISKLSTPVDQPNALFPSDSNQVIWIQENLGDDFYHFYASKVVKKVSNKKSLQLEYFLKPESGIDHTSKNTGLTKNSIPTDVSLNHTIQALESSKISFSEDSLEWNPTDLPIVTLGEDYQKFIDDEISAGHTYKEFWNGEETTAFEDFIDEHFGFHDNALIRYLAMLGGFLIAILAFAKRAELADFFLSEDNVDRLKKWFKSLKHRLNLNL